MWCWCPSQPSLMRAEEPQKQMELPVGPWEDSGAARTTTVGGSSCHVVACPLCPLVISASPAWWSSRRTGLPIKDGPTVNPEGSSEPTSLSLPSFLPFILHLFSVSRHSSNQSPANTLPRILLCSHFLTHCVEFIWRVSRFFPPRPDRGGRCQSHDPFNRVICDNEEILFGPHTLGHCIKSRIQMQMWIN